MEDAMTRGARDLIYSHDTFGLGHLRRCRTIAHWLVEQNKDMSVIILTGSPIIGSFNFRARVDFVRIPGVIKLRSGDYTSLSLLIDIEETLALRSSIIQHTAEIFDPDIFIVDKEPLGLRGEVTETLEMLKERGTRLVLGLRDIMDEPAALVPEWRAQERGAGPARSLRPDLDLRPAADLRSAGRDRPAEIGAAQDDLYRLSAPLACRRARCAACRCRRSRRPICW